MSVVSPRLAPRLLLLTTSLLIAVAIAEVGLRTFQPWWSDGWKMWRVDPVHARGLQANVRDLPIHAHSGEFVFRFSTNAQGLRMDREVPAEPPPGHRRIVFVGDSFAFGYGVDQGKTFVDLLDAHVRRKKLPLDIVNAGYASGFTLDTEYVFTRENLERLNPDHVVVVVCLGNDLDDLATTRWHVEGDSLVAVDKRSDRIPPILKRSALVNWIVKGLIPTLRGEAVIATTNPSGEDSCAIDVEAAPERAWEPGIAARPAAPSAEMPPRARVRWLLERWAYDATQAGYGVTILIVPDGREVQTRIHPSAVKVWATIRGVFAEAATRAGVGVMDPVAAMRIERCPDGPEFYYRSDGHWTEAGHAFVARWLTGRLASHVPSESTNR